MPINIMHDIVEFHERFELTYRGLPRRLEPNFRNFRIQFLREELDEYVVAKTKAEELDALVDIVYVALGTAYLQGFDFQAAWDRVHTANMYKLRGPSARSESYDVIKPAGWKPPELADLVGE